MSAAGNRHHARGDGALPEHQPGLRRVAEEFRIHQLVAGDKGFIGGAGVPVVHVVVGPGDLADTARVRPVHMNQCGVQFEGRHGHPFPVIVGAVHQLDLRVAGNDVGAQTHFGRDEGNTPGGGPQPQQQHALVDFHHLQFAGFARLPEVGLQRDKIQRDESEHQLFHFSRRAQHTDIGAAIGHKGQVFQVRAQNFPHQGHGLAARAPATDADSHAVAELRHNLRRCHLFIH